MRMSLVKVVSIPLAYICQDDVPCKMLFATDKAPKVLQRTLGHSHFPQSECPHAVIMD